MKSTSRRSAKSGDTNDSRATNNILANPDASAIETSRQTGARHSKSRRTATLYDAVAGRVGLNGFLRDEQIRSGQTRAMAPEEILLRRVNAPDRIPVDYYNADERLDTRTQKLPDSQLLKDVHAYAADYYEATNRDRQGGHEFDFKSMDETALIAMGILLEEACKEALGHDGDMVFTEPAVYDRRVPRDTLSLRQIIGSVVPREVQEYHSSTDSSDDDVDHTQSKPRKRQRRRYGNIEAT